MCLCHDIMKTRTVLPKLPHPGLVDWFSFLFVFPSVEDKWIFVVFFVTIFVTGS